MEDFKEIYVPPKLRGPLRNIFQAIDISGEEEVLSFGDFLLDLDESDWMSDGKKKINIPLWIMEKVHLAIKGDCEQKTLKSGASPIFAFILRNFGIETDEEESGTTG